MESPNAAAEENRGAARTSSRGALRIGILALVWCGLIFASSSTVILPHDFFAWIAAHLLPNEESLHSFVLFWGASWFVIVKGWHAIEFGIVFWLILAVADRLSPRSAAGNFAITITLAVLFAMSDEYHQTFVPERGGTYVDVSIDTLGILVAAMLTALGRKARAR